MKVQSHNFILNNPFNWSFTLFLISKVWLAIWSYSQHFLNKVHQTQSTTVWWSAMHKKTSSTFRTSSKIISTIVMLKLNYFNCFACITLCSFVSLIMSLNSFKNDNWPLFSILHNKFLRISPEIKAIVSLSHCHEQYTCTSDDNQLKQYYLDTNTHTHTHTVTVEQW
jgi:hypothetical protein